MLFFQKIFKTKNSEDFSWFNQTNNPPRILIIKTDVIGDYILFRPFLEKIRQNPRFSDAHITLLGTSAFQGIATFLDTNTIDSFFFLNTKAYQEKRKTRIKKHIKALLKENFSLDYDLILIPNINRNQSDAFIRNLLTVLKGKEIVINDGDKEYIFNKYKLRNDRPYTRIIQTGDVFYHHEMENYRRFFEAFLDEKISPKNFPYIQQKFKQPSFSNYVVINPAAREKERAWHVQNYARLIQFLVREKKKNIILTCSESEKDICQKIQKLANLPLTIIAGANFEEIIPLYQHADLYIGNDSGGFHLATALKTQTICIASGKTFFRFLGYPELSHLIILTPPGTREFYEKVRQNRTEEEMLPIHLFCSYSVNFVTLERVIKAVNHFLK